MNTKQENRSLSRGLSILSLFLKNEQALTLTEISNLTGLNISTTSRLINTLIKESYLQRNYRGRFGLGAKIYEFSKIIKDKNSLYSVALPYLTELRDYYDETASLYVVRNNNRICIQRVESNQPLKRTINVGESLPLSRGAAGHLLFAWLSPEKRKRLMKYNPDISSEYLSTIRRNGYAENDGLQEPGVYAIATPIFNEYEKVIAALSITGPSYRITPNLRKKMLLSLKDKSTTISNLLKNL